jgi:hypothetical protein
MLCSASTIYGVRVLLLPQRFARAHTHTQHTHSLPSLSLPQPYDAVLECIMKTSSSRNAFLVCVRAYVHLSVSLSL